MAKKTENKRCPLQQECERKCECIGHELDCDYYFNNGWGGNTIPDQEEIREARALEIENRLLENWPSEESTGGIVQIPIEQLFHHPDNPRKNIGDVTELAESIKAKGILQNLTVVPGHKQTPDEWSALEKQYLANPSEELRVQINTKWINEGYTVVIGNRRLEGGKLAGLETLPCIIADMTPEEQVQTMLLENMQRSDLTAYEQAQGFQMMMDMGETEDSIAEKTGFSKATVRHRLNIAKLDQKLLQDLESQEDFQLSLTDLYALEKIKDVKRRNKVLEKAQDGRHIKVIALQEERDERREDNKMKVVDLLSSLQVKQKQDEKYSLYTQKWEVVKEIDLDKDPPQEIELPDDDDREIFWCENYSNIKLFRKGKKKEKEELTPEQLERRELDAKKRKIEALNKDMRKEIALFVVDIIDGKIEMLAEKTAIPLLWNCLLFARFYFSLGELLVNYTGKKSWELKNDEKAAAEKAVSSMSIQEQMLRILRVNSDLLEVTADYYCHFKDEAANAWNTVLDVLKEYGFVWSDQQFVAVLDGTHKLYVKETDSDDEEDFAEEEEDFFDEENPDDAVDEAIAAALEEEGAADE